MAPLVKLASCNLNQWAMDFKGNLARIEESVRVAKAAGCTFRTGPELEITGYSCEDYFHEQDTFDHAADSLALLLKSDLTVGEDELLGAFGAVGKLIDDSLAHDGDHRRRRARVGTARERQEVAAHAGTP